MKDKNFNFKKHKFDISYKGWVSYNKNNKFKTNLNT